LAGRPDAHKSKLVAMKRLGPLTALLAASVLLLVVPASPTPGPGGGARSTPIYEDLDVEWGVSTSGKVLTADLRWPQGAIRRLPVVILVHGGARTGDKSKMAVQGEDLAQLGYFTMATNYTLKTDKPNYVEYALRDLVAAMKWVSQRPDVNPRRIGMLGASNGGMLVTVLALGAPRLKAVVAWSGNAGDPPPEPLVQPAPRWAALSSQDQHLTMDSEVATQQAWVEAGSPTGLYATDELCHGNCFWDYVDPVTGTEVARAETIAWLDRYLKR
jgi:dienelactone hydrolase